MVLATKDSNGIATQAQGAFANCGPGSNGYELSYSCQGPACLSLDSSFQNVICHKDGRNTLICSNDVKCKPGASAYQSNFTFSQNEPDPWSPVMDNKPDIWVPQDQHILVGGCARFSVSSDGTKQGTKVNDEGQDDVCRGVQMFSTAGGHAGQISTATGHPQAGATQKPLVFQGRGQRRSITKPTLLFALLLSFVLLVHRAEASALHHHHIEPRRRSDVRTRQTSDSVKAFAEDLRADIARKASRQGADGETYAQSLVTNVVSSVCQDHFDGSPPGTFSHEIVRDCVASTYGNDRLPQPALQFLAIFGATLLCDYVISETYPSGQEFQPNGCEGLQDFFSRDQAGASPTSSTKQTSRQMLSTSTQLPVATTDAGTLGTLNQGSTSYATASPEAALSKLSSINVLTTNKLETDLTLSDEQTTLGSLPVIHLAPTAPSLPPLSIESSLKPSSFQPDTSTPAFSQKLSVTSASDATSATGIFSGGLLSTHALGAGPTVEILDIGSQAPSLVATLPSAQTMLPQPLVETQEDASLQSNVVGMPFLTDSMSRIPEPVTTSSTQTSASSLGVFAVSQDVTHSAASSGPIATTTTTMQFVSMTDLSTTLLGMLRSKISPTLGLAWNTPWSDSPFSSVFETMAVDPEASSITTSNAVTLDKSPSFTVAHLSKTQGSSSLIESVFPQDGSQRLTASIPASATSIATIDNAPSVLVPDEQQPSTSVPMNTDDAGFAKSIAMASSPERLSITTSGVQQDAKPSTMKSTNSITTTTPESVSVASSGMIAALRSSASDMSTTSAALVTVPQNLKQGVPVVTVKPVSSQSVSTSAPPSALPTYLTYMSVEVIDHLGATSNESPLAMLSLDPSKLSSTIPASTTGTKVSLRVGSPIVPANASPSGPTGENSLPGPSQPADPTPTSAGSTIAEAGSTPGSSMAYLGFSTHALNGAVQASSSFSPTFSISLSHHIATLLASSSSPASSRSSWLSNNETFFANSEPTSDRSTIRPNRSSTIASSVVLSTLIASPTSGRSISPIAVRPSTTVEGLSTITPTPAVHSTSVFKPTSSNSSTHTILTQICLPSSSTPDFCSGSGCVSLMKDNAHCGACNRVCEHECYQGVCVCPDFTTPNTNNECVERSGLDLCVNGYAQNVFRICAPSATSSQLKASALVAPQRSLTRTTTPILTTARPAVSRFSLADTVATQSTTESLYCPPALPDICDGGCFNTKTERNHCGGCGRLCSGECIDNHCVASSTQSRAQPTSTGRTVLTSNPPIASVVHVAVTSTVEPVVMYIMKGLAGPQQA